MIPATFDYHAPTSVDEALRLLAEAGGSGKDVKVLGGGQSLLPVLRLRLAAPEVVVDLGRIDDLRDVRDDGDAIVIGAMTTHDTVLRAPAGAPARAAAGRWPPRRSPTRRCATAARSAGRWCTPTRPVTCRRRRWRWTPRW